MKHAMMITAKYASQPSIEKAAGKGMPRSPWQMGRNCQASLPKMGWPRANRTGRMCALCVYFWGDLFDVFSAQVEMEDGVADDVLEATPPSEPASPFAAGVAGRVYRTTTRGNMSTSCKALRSGVKFCMVRLWFSIPQESFLLIRSDHQTCSTSGRSLSRTCSQRLSRTVYRTLARV